MCSPRSKRRVLSNLPQTPSHQTVRPLLLNKTLQGAGIISSLLYENGIPPELRIRPSLLYVCEGVFFSTPVSFDGPHSFIPHQKTLSLRFRATSRMPATKWSFSFPLTPFPDYVCVFYGPRKKSIISPWWFTANSISGGSRGKRKFSLHVNKTRCCCWMLNDRLSTG